MSIPDFVLKVGDTGPPITAILADAAGVAVPLGGGAVVRFHMRPLTGGAATVDRVASIVSAPDGSVRHDWQTGDSAVAGWFDAEWEVVFGTGVKETFPNDGHLRILITEQLA